MQPENEYASIRKISAHVSHPMGIEGTSHLITLAAGRAARAIPVRESVGYAMGIPIVQHVSHELRGLPRELEDDTLYITSSVFARIANKWNVVSPDTAPDMCTRNSYGQLVSTRQLIAYARRIA